MIQGRIRRLWVFDFDGTLSPIVPNRDAANLHPAGRNLLRALADIPGDFVAVLSSRALSDLMFRVPLPKIYLGGGSGMEWKFPGGRRIGMTAEERHRAEQVRDSLRPLLAACSKISGVEIEDKYWSMAIHFRKVDPQNIPALDDFWSDLSSRDNIRMFSGPCVVDIQVLQEAGKTHGLARLCRFLRYDPTRGGVFYAGDDQNDAAAMRWVLARKGTAVSVGGRAGVSGARSVTGTAGLAHIVRHLSGMVP